MNEATLTKEQVDLLAMVVPHMSAVGPEECNYYLRGENRPQIPKRHLNCGLRKIFSRFIEAQGTDKKFNAML